MYRTRNDAIRSERAAATAEYAVGTVAATGFAGALYVLWPFIAQLLQAILALASTVWLGTGFHPMTYLPK